MQQPNEALTFRVGLSGTYWDKRPAYSILIDGVEQVSSFASNETEYKEFTVELAEDMPHVLSIRLTNKTDADVVENEDKTAIVKDMLLNIDSIEINDIELGQLLWAASEFVPDNSSFATLKNCVNLGWNGSYNLTFSAPFYLWLLENM